MWQQKTAADPPLTLSLLLLLSRWFLVFPLKTSTIFLFFRRTLSAKVPVQIRPHHRHNPWLCTWQVAQSREQLLSSQGDLCRQHGSDLGSSCSPDGSSHTGEGTGEQFWVQWLVELSTHEPEVQQWLFRVNLGQGLVTGGFSCRESSQESMEASGFRSRWSCPWQRDDVEHRPVFLGFASPGIF